MLIKVAAPRPETEGMVANAEHPLAPGQPPPWIAPHCWKCRLPVERFTIDWIASPFYLPVQYECCGKTGGLRISAEEVLFKNKHGGVIWVNRT